MQWNILLFILLFGHCATWEMYAQSSKKPNIVLILADDLGWSDVGAYGGEIPTPHLDSLAAGGVRFTQFYTNAVCGPTRASLLTGQYAQRVGHSGTHWNHPTNYNISITLGEALQNTGYRTIAIGKWQDPIFPAKKGFDRFYGTMCAGKISYYDEVALDPFYLDTTRVTLPSDFYMTETFSDYSIQFLEEAIGKKKQDQKPFFLYLAHIAPHWPLHAREKDIAPNRERYRQHGWEYWREKRLNNQHKRGLVAASQTLSPLPSEIHSWKEDPYQHWQAERMAVYSAQVQSVDKSAGRIVDLLRKSGELDNTLLIFLSDNGPAPDGDLKPTKSFLGFGPDSLANTTWRLNGQAVQPGSGPDNLPGPPHTFQAYGLAWALTSSTPFRGTKLTGYEGGIRDPFIAHWPAGISQKGSIIQDACHLIDIMPTLLEVGKGTYPSEYQGRKLRAIDGHSLVPLFKGKQRVGPPFLAWRVPQHRVLREGKWKIISKDERIPWGPYQLEQDRAALKDWELYNLELDPAETKNEAASHPEIVSSLSAQWEKWIRPEGK